MLLLTLYYYALRGVEALGDLAGRKADALQAVLAPTLANSRAATTSPT